MPGKNKQQKNAFYFFMQDLMPQLKREGRVFPNGMADVVPIAHPRYKALSDKERERFENMAKEAKKRMRGQPGDAIRQDNVGNIIANRRDEVSDYEKEREKEVRELMRHWPQGDITEEVFHFIDVQSLCKTKDGEYLPVEIAIIEFSLKDGIRRAYHEFLRPGQIPTGMRYECMSQSEDTHKIPVEGHPDATNNYLSVQNSIQNFLNRGGDLPRCPPVFALREDWKKVDYTLVFVNEHSQLGSRAVRFRVFELESLLVAMVSHAGESAPTKAAVNDVLTSTTHDYHQGLKCKFHEELECKHCSLLWVRKFCYAIADALKKLYDYEIKPRTHLPTVRSQQFSVAHEELKSWSGSPVKVKNNYQSAPKFKPPTNLPKTESVLMRSQGQPAPIFRPPGAADLDYAKNKDMRYQQQQSWRAAAPSNFSPGASVPSTRHSSPPINCLPEEKYYQEVPEIPSNNVDLIEHREATWVPNMQSRASWSRRTTPASTPRATPLPTPQATPLPTPLPTPKHSPPREGAHFPSEFIKRNEVDPPPGFGVRYPNTQSSFAGLPPPGFGRSQGRGAQLNTAACDYFPAGGDAMTSLHNDFPSLSVQPPAGRGRGSFLRR